MLTNFKKITGKFLGKAFQEEKSIDGTNKTVLEHINMLKKDETAFLNFIDYAIEKELIKLEIFKGRIALKLFDKTEYFETENVTYFIHESWKMREKELDAYRLVRKKYVKLEEAYYKRQISSVQLDEARFKTQRFAPVPLKKWLETTIKEAIQHEYLGFAFFLKMNLKEIDGIEDYVQHIFDAA